MQKCSWPRPFTAFGQAAFTAPAVLDAWFLAPCCGPVFGTEHSCLLKAVCGRRVYLQGVRMTVLAKLFPLKRLGVLRECKEEGSMRQHARNAYARPPRRSSFHFDRPVKTECRTWATPWGKAEEVRNLSRLSSCALPTQPCGPKTTFSVVAAGGRAPGGFTDTGGNMQTPGKAPDGQGAGAPV